MEFYLVMAGGGGGSQPASTGDALIQMLCMFGPLAVLAWFGWRVVVATEQPQRDATKKAAAKDLASASDKRHYIHQDERQLGPFSYVELQKYLDEEVFSVKDLAAEESSDEWVPLGIYMNSLNSQLPSMHERRKFSIPKLIAIAGLVLLVAACLYPPVYSESYEGRMWIGFGGTKTIDYGPEFRYDPNWRQRNVAERQQALNEVMYGRTETVHINTQRLLIDCCIILATTVIGVTLTSRRRVRR